MKLLALQKQHIRTRLNMILYGIVLASLYVLFAEGFGKPVGYINAIMAGLFGGLLVAYTESVIFSPQRRAFGFLKSMLVKTSIYILFLALFIPIIIAIVESLYYDIGLLEHINSERFESFLIHRHFRFTLPIAFFGILIMVFTLQMNRKLGQSVLMNHISGRFHLPKEVDRIFMMLDLRDSTTIAERMGPLEFHKFMYTFFADITEPILANRGIIYRYIGDQVIVIWNYEKGLEDINCIKTYFSIQSQLKYLREKYLTQYGLIPRFSASFHCGSVILGEIGDIKSQLVYHGEILHQTSEIEKLHNALNLEESILISSPLLEKLDLPGLYEAVNVGTIQDETTDEIEIYTLQIPKEVL